MMERISCTKVDEDDQGFFIVAYTEQGEVFGHFTRFEDKQEADVFATMIYNVGQIATSLWTKIRTVYASPAYIKDQQ